MVKRQFGRYSVNVTNEEKQFFPGGVTKGDVIEYYRNIAEHLLPYTRERPAVMQRFPDGIEGEGFYQKEVPDYFPSWVKRAEVDVRENGRESLVVCGNAATLVYLANQGCVALHVWLSRAERPERPERIVFDLDPPGGGFNAAKQGALDLRDLLTELDMSCFVKLTGSRGVHVEVPIRRQYSFDEVRNYARRVAEHLSRSHPGHYTVEQRKDRREGRLFIDYLRNAYAQTTVAPYSLRPLQGAPVASPLDWDELEGIDSSGRYTIHNIFRRLSHRDDPWEEYASLRQGIDTVKLKNLS